MEKPRLFFAAALLSGAFLAQLPAFADPAPPAQSKERLRPFKTYTIADFVETTSVGGASFSRDEKRILFSSNRSGVWNVYSMPSTGGDWLAITNSAKSNSYAVGYFPNSDALLITRDQDGDELNHLFVIDPTGKEKDLTPGKGLKAFFAGWNRAGDRFYVGTNERDQRFFDLYRYDATTYARELLFENNDGYSLGELSDDERFLALSKTNTTNDNNLFLWDRQEKKSVLLSPHEGDALFSAEAFDPGQVFLYYTSNLEGEFSRLRRYHLASGRHEDFQVESWDILYSYFSQNGKYRVTAINVDGSTEIQLFDAATNRRISLPDLPAGEITNLTIARSEKKLAFYLNGDRQPNELYLLDLEKGTPQRLTTSLNPKVDASDLVEAQVVRFKSFDALEVPNILWKPLQANAQNRVPAIVLVHGGPGGQTTRGYNYVAQFLANNGYAVLGINNRGSSGYGKKFFAADDGKHGREPLWDCIAAKKYLQSLDWVDNERIGIMGGSYGGYMVLAALAFQPDEFKVGIDIFGVSNWLRTLESIPPYWESFRQALYVEIGDPATQREHLIATSPLFHADKIRMPLMVLQGQNDPRVIKAESDDIVAAVKKNGVPVEYIVFDDEGHGFSKKKNQIEGYGAVLRFLDRYLGRELVQIRPAG